MKLVEHRNPLFSALASSDWPFNSKWQDVLRELPNVAEQNRSGNASKGKHHLYAYSNPVQEICEIRRTVLSYGSTSIDGDCLHQTLNNWVNGNGGQATVGDLWHVMKKIGLSVPAHRFFRRYFDFSNSTYLFSDYYSPTRHSPSNRTKLNQDVEKLHNEKLKVCALKVRNGKSAKTEKCSKNAEKPAST